MDTKDNESTMAMYNSVISKLGDPGPGEQKENVTIYNWKKEINGNVSVITLTIDSEKINATLTGNLN